MRRLDGWTRTGGADCRGRETPRMADGSPNWSLPAHEPDNSPRAVAGRVLALASVYVAGAAMSGAGLWLINQPPAQDAMASLILAMPGPGPVWQSAEAVAVMTAVVAAAIVVARLWRRRAQSSRVAAAVTVQVMSGPLDPGIPAGQLVFRRFDSPALSQPQARPALRDAGSTDIETLAFRIVPPLLLLTALVNAVTGSEQLRQTVWPLLAGAVLLAWLGRHLRRSQDSAPTDAGPTHAVGELPACESCGWAPGTVTVLFPDGVTFHVCALCLTSGSHTAFDLQVEAHCSRPSEVQP